MCCSFLHFAWHITGFIYIYICLYVYILNILYIFIFYVFALYLSDGYYLVPTNPLLLILCLYLIGSWAFWLLSCVLPVIAPRNWTGSLAFLILILAAIFSWMCFITSLLALSLLTALENYPQPNTACPDHVPSRQCL